MKIVLPDRDTVKYNAGRHRIAASTNPTSRAFINYNEVKVYGSGAFVGLHYLTSDTTQLHIAVLNSMGDSLFKDIVFIKPIPKTYAFDEVYIDNISQPTEDRWMIAGDVLEVKIKASPGQTPVFDIEGVESGIPMRELDPKKAGGFGGIYVGKYKIKEGDECADVPIRFRISRNIFSSEKAFSSGKISIISDSLPRVAEVIGKRPFLNAGLGSDRLGGAKLGFLVEGVRVIITGKVGDQYRVQLSGGMEAWLPQEYAQLSPVNATLPYTLTGSISVTGNDSEDVIRVGLGQKVPYTSEQLTNPMAIVVNIFGATSNSNWITHQISAKEIQQVKCTQVGANHYQLTIYLNQKQHWGYDISYEGTSMKIRVRRTPVVPNPSVPLSGMTIAIDAGHGIGSQGALGSLGTIEMNITLAIAKELNEQLQAKGIKTVMTRETDDNVLMGDRAEKILSSNATILVSIHCNSTGESSDAEQVKGTSTYYRYPGFKSLSDIMYEKMLELGLGQWGVTGNFNFSLSGPTQLPNVLVETAFLSNPEDEMKLIDPEFRKQVTTKIIEGLEEFVLRSTK
ncbi:MAG: N-acetylmuramoyl-L-alanine amidase [Bacteroidota bacterium]|nr:N-acetylmuramoyl-L-alanine amidase [Bacteroidota bacterium]